MRKSPFPLTRRGVIAAAAALPFLPRGAWAAAGGYPVLGTGQTGCFDDRGRIDPPPPGAPFHGQDAQYPGTPPDWRDNGDGTVSDAVTGLMWQKAVEWMEWSEAAVRAFAARTGGHADWRVPTIKELYSLVLFTGNQGSADPSDSTPPPDARPFLDTGVFDFAYPETGRYIDVQLISGTVYTGQAMGQDDSFFGLNVADGRIKAYPMRGNRSSAGFPARFVRGNPAYGRNAFEDRGDGTVLDVATGLMWCREDSGAARFAGAREFTERGDGAMNWEEALAFCEALDHAGHSDWRLPDAKELHSILDHARGPDATGSAAIDPVFAATGITNEAGVPDFPAYWTSTSFEPGRDAVVIYFGRAMGYLQGRFLDVHGAGCQRTDPKSGTPDYGHGPQGDVRRIYNHVRPVRTA